MLECTICKTKASFIVLAEQCKSKGVLVLNDHSMRYDCPEKNCKGSVWVNGSEELLKERVSFLWSDVIHEGLVCFDGRTDSGYKCAIAVDKLGDARLDSGAPLWFYFHDSTPTFTVIDQSMNVRTDWDEEAIEGFCLDCGCTPCGCADKK